MYFKKVYGGHAPSVPPLNLPLRTYLFYIVNVMGADVLAMQVARALETMLLCWTELIQSLHIKGYIVNWLRSSDTNMHQ